jgi:beta-glucosidase
VAENDANSGQFPPDFVWGVATSAYQIEGAATADGRGPSIWDTFSGRPGTVLNGDTGATATAHYERYRDDIAIMADLGIPAYRFSIAWPRIQPTGSGAPLQAGLDFYRRLVDGLREVGIEPVPMLYHWDLPEALEDAGGWPARETALRFADYASIVANSLRGQATRWATLNEPWCSAFLGYGSGYHAPGRREPAAAIAAAHHLLLAHGLATAAIRAADQGSQVGIALNLTNARTASPDPGHRLRDGVRRFDGLLNRLFLDPLLKGSYPGDVEADLRPIGRLPVRDGDLPAIATPLDWLGVNYYSDRIFAEDDGAEADLGGAFPGVTHIVDTPVSQPTDTGWPVTPRGLGDLLIRLRDSYETLPPLLVTENGAAYDDPPAPDGSIDDRRRIAYLDAHIREVQRAIAAGVEVDGYFVWSLLDNFEWAEGYSKRFGLIHVDYDTMARTPRASAAWYRGVIARNGPVATG